MSGKMDPKQEINQTQQRRGFLKKAGVLSAFAALPVRSVWGSDVKACTVSGNLSNNPSATCVVTALSPGYWHGRVGPGLEMEDVPWCDIFNGPPLDFAGANEFLCTRFLPECDLNSPQLDKKVRGPHNINRFLFCAYLNAATGRYGPLTMTAEAYANLLYNEALNAQANGTLIAFASALNDTWN